MTIGLTAAICFSVASFVMGRPSQSLSDDRRPSMTRECDERMWNLAYRLAHSGEHRNYQAIEWELQAFGFPQARQLLDHERVRMDTRAPPIAGLFLGAPTPETSVAVSC